MVNLVASKLCISFGSRAILHDIDLELEGGSLTSIIGPNGAGKSTLARALCGLLVPDSGAVRLGDVAIEARGKTMARRIAYLPQGQTVHWPVSVERLVALGRLPHLAPFSRLAATDREAIERAMKSADVLSLRDRPVTELSGGERARALIGRMLAAEAELLIADEPLAALDPGHQLHLMELLRKQADQGRLVVSVLHELTMAARFSDRVVLIDEGRIVADGKPQTVLTPENLERCYDVRAWSGVIEGFPVIVPISRSSPPGAENAR